MNILFVCTGNTCRSPMAEGLMIKQAAENNLDVKVGSAGVVTADGLLPSINSVIAMEEKGIDIKGFESALITEELINETDIILTMTEAHKNSIFVEYGHILEDKVFTLSEYIGQSGDIHDPYGESLEVYKEVADELEDKISELVKLLSNK